MQNIDLATAKAAKATDRRALAVLAYDNAVNNPEGANWRAVADLLRLALPATKAKPPAAVVETSRFAPWADYDVSKASGRRLGKSPVVVVTFEGGEIVRAPAVSLPGKPINIARALRVAFAFYRARIARHYGGMHSDGSDCVAVPAIVSAICDNGAEFDAADCSARTAEHRAGAFELSPAETALPALPRTVEKVRMRYRRAILRPERAARAGDYFERRAARLAAAAAAVEPSAPPPVAPAFKVRPVFLASSRMVPAPGPARPRVAPSCILRVVA